MRDGIVFAALQQPRAQAAPREIRVNEECADLGGIPRRIELGGIAIGARIAAKQRAAPAPAATAGQSLAGFDDEVAAVADELRVHAERAAQGAFDLRGRVVVPAELARRDGDQLLQRGNVRKAGAPDGEVFGAHALSSTGRHNSQANVPVRASYSAPRG